MRKKHHPAPTIEVVPYSQADWAPDMPGAEWAWRVVGANDNVVRGATRASKQQANKIAHQTAERMAFHQGVSAKATHNMIMTRPTVTQAEY